ncbi:MAG: hypothetical protein JXP34_11635 [Planctomycetes bacterium]|nr:hypothetical protein [Planctomycetota bacterium]
MRTIRLSTASLAALAACAGGCASGGVRLLAPRVEIRQKTEAEIDLPPGCVVTGIGARAHYDNITTLWIAFREVRADGSLGQPREIHLGSEPDRACEAKIFLPDGWIVAGFGARGSPEWDVSTLRVWGRRWDPDGGGEIRVWSDGREPGGGLERMILLADPDRVITGAGLRLHHNDIAGIYARSARLVRVPEEVQGIRRVPAGADAPVLALLPRALGPIPLAAFDPERLQGIIVGAWEEGIREVAVGGEGLADTAGEAALDLCAAMLAEPLRPADEVVAKVLRARVGEDGVEFARRALARVPAVARLVFSAAGETYLGARGLPAPEEVPEIGDTKRALDAVAGEKETARWLLEQSRRDIALLRETRTSPWLANVASDLDDLGLAADLWEPIARADVLSRMYLIDGAPETAARARRAVQSARDAPGKPIFGDREPLLAHLLARLETPEAETALGAAIARVRSLIEADAMDEAAERLGEMIEDVRLGAALVRRIETVGRLASSISVFGADPDEVRVLWGGDGRWRIGRRAGRWAWITAPEGPCVYFDAVARPSRALLRFEYFDDAPGQIHIHASAIDPRNNERNDYLPAAPVAMQGTGIWQEAEVMLEGTSFFGRQNLGADFRILPNRRGVGIRAVRIEAR